MNTKAITDLLAPYASWILLAVSVVVIAFGVPMATRIWRDLHEEEPAISDADLFAELHRGDAASKMTDDEFRRVRTRLLGPDGGREAQPPRGSATSRTEAGRKAEGTGEEGA
jgi:hypothetical protein